jgi:hypothetical protein
MRLFNKFEFGISRGEGNRLVWVKPGFWRGVCDCSIYEFGPFYFTILRGDCRENLPLE